MVVSSFFSSAPLRLLSKSPCVLVGKLYKEFEPPIFNILIGLTASALILISCCCWRICEVSDSSGCDPDWFSTRSPRLSNDLPCSTLLSRAGVLSSSCSTWVTFASFYFCYAINSFMSFYRGISPVPALKGELIIFIKEVVVSEEKADP